MMGLNEREKYFAVEISFSSSNAINDIAQGIFIVDKVKPLKFLLR